MKAAVTPEPFGRITVTEVAAPEPRSGEVLVRVHAASVNQLDRAAYEGKAMGGAAGFPLIQGVDAAGVVESGSGAIPTGARVVVKPTIACRRCRSCLRHMPANCEEARTFGIHRQGGFAQFLAVPRTNAFVLPDSLSFAEGAAAAHTHAIVLRMIRAAGECPAESTMLVTGAGGALGTAAVQLGAALGYRVVAVASSDPKLEVAGRIGASMLANRSVLRRFASAVRTETDGVGVDLVIETTGDPDVLEDALEATAKGGRVVIVGARPGAAIEVDPLALYRSRRGLIGSAGSNDRDFSDVFSLMDEHGIHPVIARSYPLEEAQLAMDAISDRERVGKIVIEIGETA
jgi:NADPH:quinone reductase-like Zn-dependent oxidoreductase